MKIATATLSTTHVDAHNERMMLSALESSVEQISKVYIPVGVEHDPRIPPIGRIRDAHIEALEDGEYAVVGTLEIFEPGDRVQFKDETRTLFIRSQSLGSVEIGFDRAFRDTEDQVLIEEVAKILKSKPREEAKKSVDPLAVLVLTGSFILGGIASGLLQAIGEDLYEIFKGNLKGLLNRNKQDGQDRLLSFIALVTVNDYPIEMQIILTNPSDEDIDHFFREGLSQLDSLAPRLFQTDQGIQKVVLEYSERNLKIKFGVRRDAFPLFPKDDDTLLASLLNTQNKNYP